MVLGYGIKKPLRKKIWSEAVNTAIALDGILVNPGETSSLYQKFFGNGYNAIIYDTKTSGQLCVVTDRTGIKNKLDDRRKLCYWMGYTRDHSAGTHRMYNHVTKRIILSRDVTFLGDSRNNEKSHSRSKISTS